jgi:exodeoxyribonuclease V beta subunit
VYPPRFNDSDAPSGLRKLQTHHFAALLDGKVNELGICAQMDKLFKLQALERQTPHVLYEHAAQSIAKSVLAYEQGRGELSFDGLLSYLHDALSKGDGEGQSINQTLANTIARQFPVALIDEFQDTDQVQFGIFDKIYLRQDADCQTSLLMIGDPKQAIYSFRGGDIYTYLKAANAVGDAKYTLATNYRSTAQMVEAVNYLFECGDALEKGAFRFSDGQSNPIPFYPVNANGLSSRFVIEGKRETSLVFWEHVNYKDNGKLAPHNAQQWRNDMANACATQIAELLQGALDGQTYFCDAQRPEQRRTVSPRDIAVLVNNKNEAAAVKQALMAKNLNSVYLSTRGSVLSTPVAKEILYWLKAMAQPSQVSLIRRALGTQSINRSVVELQQMLNDETLIDQMVQRFSAYRIIWTYNGVLPALRKLMLDFNVHSQLLSQRDGERIITDLLHIGEVLQQASITLDGIESLLSYFEQALYAPEQDEVDFNKPRLESDNDLIKIVTVHKSKGLQYPLVFLPYASAASNVPKHQNFFTYHKEGELKVSFDPSEAKQALQEELAQEDIRKLYVALTRAKYMTWVGCANNTEWQKSGLAYLLNASAHSDDPSKALQSLVQGAPASIDVCPLPQPSDASYRAPTRSEIGHARTSTRKVEQMWNTYSYSSIQYDHATTHLSNASANETHNESTNIDPRVQEQLQDNAELTDVNAPPTLAHTLAQDVLNVHTFHRGAMPGTFLHNILEWACKTGFSKVASSPHLLKDHVSAQIESAGWQQYNDIVFEWMMGVITQPFTLATHADEAPAKGCLSELTLVIAEMEFWFSTHKADLHKIDQIVRNKTLKGAPRATVDGFGRRNDAAQTIMSGIFKGFIDLTFEANGQYYVLDYKSNHLGDDDSAYTLENMELAILAHRYDLQFVIYLVALHRLLKQRLPDYDYEQHVGGCVYYFLRGYASETQGVFTTKPSLEVIEAIDEIFTSRALSLTAEDVV